MKNKIQSNIWKYTIASVANKRIFVAILGAYYLTIEGVTPQTIGIIALCGSFASFIFEIPSGYVSDKIGHKQALVVSRLAMLASSLCFLVADSPTLLMLASVIMSIGMAFDSGTGSAFMHETLTALGREKEYSSVVGKISSIGFAVPIFLTVLIPFFVEISYKIPFLVMGVVDIIGLIAVLSLTRPPVKSEHIEEIQASNFKMVMKEAYSLNYFTIALFSGILSAFLLSVAAFRAPYQVYLGVPVIWFGVFIGLGRALASFMLMYSGKMEKYFTLSSFYRFQYIIHILIIAMVGLFENIFAVVFLLTLNSGLHWGLSKVDEGYQLQVIGTSKFKATLLSTGAQIESLMTAMLGFFLGWLIQKYSYGLGFLYISLVVGLVLTILHIRMRRLYKGT